MNIIVGESVRKYFRDIWVSRYFWYHLVLSELRIKYRRSALGMIWTFLHPILLTCLLAVVFGTIFKSPFLEFAPYVYSGLIFWEFLTGSFVQGSSSIINAEAYVRQVSHPLSIYTLKQSLVVLINFLIAAIGLVIWCWVRNPGTILPTIFSLPTTIVFLFMLSWSISTVSAFVNTKFRDFQQLLMIVLQAVYFISPIYFETKLFVNAGLPGLVDHNPISHMLSLIRAPLMYGDFPTLENYGYVLGVIIILGAISIYKIMKEEKEMIFYL